MVNQTDEQLVADYLQGDEKALEILIRRHLNPLYNFICRFTRDASDAEDIVQEVFVKMWRNLHKFNPKKSLAPYQTSKASFGSGFKTWLFSIARNAAIDFLRKKRTIPFSEFPALETLADPSLLPNEIMERRDLSESLDTVMEKLPLKYRLVLFLRYNDHFAFREIAELLNESVNTIKSRHRRALIFLRKLFLKA